MSQPDDAFARRVAEALDRGLDRIDGRARERLAAARARAMAGYVEHPEPAWRLAWATTAGAHGGAHGLRYAVVAGFLVLAMIGIGFWQSVGPASEIAEIDASLLTDELPINAYLDKGFDSWLKRASR